ncbi:hypothetical protein [Azospirillum argentinense]
MQIGECIWKLRNKLHHGPLLSTDPDVQNLNAIIDALLPDLVDAKPPRDEEAKVVKAIDKTTKELDKSASNHSAVLKKLIALLDSSVMDKLVSEVRLLPQSERELRLGGVLKRLSNSLETKTGPNKTENEDISRLLERLALHMSRLADNYVWDTALCATVKQKFEDALRTLPAAGGSDVVRIAEELIGQGSALEQLANSAFSINGKPHAGWSGYWRYVHSNLSAAVPALIGLLLLVCLPYAIGLISNCPSAVTVIGSKPPPGWQDWGNPLFCQDPAWVEALAKQLAPPIRQDTGIKTILTEGQYRASWVLAAGLLFLTSIITILAAIGVVVRCIRRPVWKREGLGTWVGPPLAYLSLLALALALTFSALVWWLLPWLFGGFLAPPAPAFFSFRALDGVSRWFDGARPSEYAPSMFLMRDALVAVFDRYALPGGGRVLLLLGDLMLIATLAISIAACCTLLRRDELLEEKPTPPLKNDAAAGTADLRYARSATFLALRMRFLRGCLYMAAVLMIVGVYQIQTFYSWPSAFLSQTPARAESPRQDNATEKGAAEKQPTESRPAATGKLTDVNATTADVANLAGNLALAFGLLYSLSLAAIFVPAVLLLRDRAWDLMIAFKPAATVAERMKELDDWGLSLPVKVQLSQIAALLSPAAVGTAIKTITTMLGSS